MDQLLNRKRRVDSDQEDENVTINKKPLLDSPKYDQTTASNTNGNDNDDDDQRDAMTMNYAPTIEQDTPLSPYAADCASVETIVPYPYLVLINMEVTCDENPTNPAAVQVSKVMKERNERIVKIMVRLTNQPIHFLIACYLLSRRMPKSFVSVYTNTTHDHVNLVLVFSLQNSLLQL
jgi:hypothetical protein